MALQGCEDGAEMPPRKAIHFQLRFPRGASPDPRKTACLDVGAGASIPGSKSGLNLEN